MADPGELLAAILATAPRLGAVRLVTIDGPSGSGKSTLGTALLAGLTDAGQHAALIRTDSFATWDDPFGWWDRLETVLGQLSVGRAGRYVANDWSSGTPRPGPLVRLDPPAVLIVEGVSAGRQALADRATVTIWVEHPDRAERLERAVARDGEQIRQPLQQWQDAEDAWFGHDGTRARAQFLIQS